jgi:hypothetical protein
VLVITVIRPVLIICLYLCGRQGAAERGDHGSLCDREERLFSKGSERLGITPSLLFDEFRELFAWDKPAEDYIDHSH